MQNVDRRSAVALALAAASVAVTKPGNAQTTGSPGATETSPFPGVVIRSYGEERSHSRVQNSLNARGHLVLEKNPKKIQCRSDHALRPVPNQPLPLPIGRTQVWTSQF